MTPTTLYFLTEECGIYENICSVDAGLNQLYGEFFAAISEKSLTECLRLLTVLDDTSVFLNQLIFICDSTCCNTNCLALNVCHFAVLNDCEEIAGELIKHGGDLSRKTVEVTISQTHNHFLEKDTLIDLIVRRFNEPVKYVRKLLDEYIENSDLGSSYEFKFDFSILIPSASTKWNCSNRSEHQMRVLNEILNSFSEVYGPECSFLTHPLIEVYLTSKWRHYRRFFYILVAIHVLFVALLSSTAVVIVRNYKRYLDTPKTDISNNLFDIKGDEILRALNICLLFVGFLLFCHAIMQAYFIRLRNLVYEFEVVSNLLTSIMALFNCIYGLIKPLNFQYANQSQLIYSLTSWIMLPAWINLMLIMGRIPSLGCYSLMFTTVMKNFLKVTASFTFLIFGFALTFSLIFPLSEYFNSPLNALLKTIVMMMGEFEYTDIFSKKTTRTSKLIFLFFVISCSIILMNLTQGIAVNDVKILHEISQTIRMEKEIRFLYEFESIFNVMTTNSILRKIKKRLYDTDAIGSTLTISKNNRDIISSEVLSKLIQSYKPTKSIWNKKIKYAKFLFRCLPNRFENASA